MLPALYSLPREILSPSTNVDFLYFFACNKPAVRVRIQQRNDLVKLADWCGEYGFAFQVDDENYVCVARDIELARMILLLDGSAEPHESTLGSLLGYPPCCCNFISNIGEANIDTLAAEAATWSFVGRFRLINPTGYIEGKSLICHLPCSPKCMASLHLAERALNFIKANIHEQFFSPWLFWLKTNLEVE
ncbi:MAG: hypothetical protein KME29_02660 [Calothrix sp. FI2-JRJ7]|nr:hypothetical protein [Calothrix sp. FI2-JRJ7]